MNNINSLYTFIKQKSKEKGRPLKIICDWDECIQPINPFFWYKFAKEKGYELPQEPFEKWFDYYWDNARIEYKQNIPYTVYTGIKEIEEIRNKDPDWWSREGLFNEMVRKPAFKIMDAPNYYEEAPFLSITDELLSAIKEDLISKLVFISSSPNGPDSRKRKKFDKIFAKFPNTELILEERYLRERQGERKEYRWERIKKSHPDFDIFIDDSPTIINQAQENLPADKLFVTPDYKLNRPFINNKSNIYHVQNKLSDLKDQDFAIAALELKTKQLENELSSTKQLKRERERENNLLNDWRWNSNIDFGDLANINYC